MELASYQNIRNIAITCGGVYLPCNTSYLFFFDPKCTEIEIIYYFLIFTNDLVMVCRLIINTRVAGRQYKV